MLLVLVLWAVTVQACDSAAGASGGDISIREFSDGIEALGLPMSKPQVKMLFNEIDTSGDGSVDAAEIAGSILGFDNGQAKTTEVRKSSERIPKPVGRIAPTKLSSVARSSRRGTATIQTPLLPRTPGAPTVPKTPGSAMPRTAKPRTPGTAKSLLRRSATPLGRSVSTPPMSFPMHGPAGTPGPGPRGGGWPASSMSRVALAKTPSRLIVRDLRQARGGAPQMNGMNGAPQMNGMNGAPQMNGANANKVR